MVETIEQYNTIKNIRKKKDISCWIIYIEVDLPERLFVLFAVFKHTNSSIDCC